jgi:GntR family transcriptional regulator/MocR family aminotransferase
MRAVDGQVLPSSRLLSQLLNVGRNTLIAMYTQLQDEELIVTDSRRGTRVTHCVPVSDKQTQAGSSDVFGMLSRRSATFVAQLRTSFALAPGVPDASHFPVEAWRKAMLVAAALAAMMYANNGDHAWVETSGYPGAVDAFRMMGLTLSPISVDLNGADLTLPAKLKSPAIIYLTPCFQYPAGVALAPDRRRQILDFAKQHNAVIFEDDYDSEFRDVSQARPALAATRGKHGAIVLHAGTFSKLIFPAARIAWLVVPKSHVARSQQCLKALGGGSNTLAQAAVAEILNNGSLAKHLQRARHIYTQRRQALLEALEKVELLHPPRDTGGSLSMLVKLKKPISADRLSIQLKKQQLGVQFVEELMWDKPAASRVKGLVLGLGNVSTLQI